MFSWRASMDVGGGIASRAMHYPRWCSTDLSALHCMNPGTGTVWCYYIAAVCYAASPRLLKIAADPHPEGKTTRSPMTWTEASEEATIWRWSSLSVSRA